MEIGKNQTKKWGDFFTFCKPTKTDYLTQKNLSAYSSKVSKKNMPKEILNNESMQKEPLKKKSSSSNSKSSKISKAKNDVFGHK